MTVDIESFLDRFAAFGRAPSVEGYLPLFHPDATLFDSGMERPLRVPEIPEHIRGVLAAVPDFGFAIEHWRLRGDTLFVEADNRATLGGEPLRWGSVYCITLAGDRVRRGRRYYDRRPLLARLDPSLGAVPSYAPVHSEGLAPGTARTPVERFVEDYTALWQQPTPEGFVDFYGEKGTIRNPGMDRPIARDEIPGYYRFLLAVAPDLTMERVSWAGDESLVFVEWIGRGSIAGTPIRLPVVDGWALEGGLASDGRAYFDSTVVAQALAKASSAA